MNVAYNKSNNLSLLHPPHGFSFIEDSLLCRCRSPKRKNIMFLRTLHLDFVLNASDQPFDANFTKFLSDNKAVVV